MVFSVNHPDFQKFLICCFLCFPVSCFKFLWHISGQNFQIYPLINEANTIESGTVCLLLHYLEHKQNRYGCKPTEKLGRQGEANQQQYVCRALLLSTSTVAASSASPHHWPYIPKHASVSLHSPMVMITGSSWLIGRSRWRDQQWWPVNLR